MNNHFYFSVMIISVTLASKADSDAYYFLYLSVGNNSKVESKRNSKGWVKFVMQIPAEIAIDPYTCLRA